MNYCSRAKIRPANSHANDVSRDSVYKYWDIKKIYERIVLINFAKKKNIEFVNQDGAKYTYIYYPMEKIDTSSNFLVIFLSINNQPTQESSFDNANLNTD